jgi:hypothetical protein
MPARTESWLARNGQLPARIEFCPHEPENGRTERFIAARNWKLPAQIGFEGVGSDLLFTFVGGGEIGGNLFGSICVQWRARTVEFRKSGRAHASFFVTTPLGVHQSTNGQSAFASFGYSHVENFPTINLAVK